MNLVDGSTNNIQAIANADNTSQITVSAESMSLGGSVVTLTATAAIDTSAKASTAIATVETSLQNVNEALARLGTGARKLEIQNTFVTKLSDSLKAGIGNLVDADLAVESARLQLGVQALSIANSAPQMLLGLFR